MNEIMMRSGAIPSLQIGFMGTIDLSDDFSLTDKTPFQIKNDGSDAVSLEVTLSRMEDGQFIETVFDVGWNPEIVKAVKANSDNTLDLKYGY